MGFWEWLKEGWKKVFYIVDIPSNVTRAIIDKIHGQFENVYLEVGKRYALEFKTWNFPLISGLFPNAKEASKAWREKIGTEVAVEGKVVLVQNVTVLSDDHFIVFVKPLANPIPVIVLIIAIIAVAGGAGIFMACTGIRKVADNPISAVMFFVLLAIGYFIYRKKGQA